MKEKAKKEFVLSDREIEEMKDKFRPLKKEEEEKAKKAFDLSDEEFEIFKTFIKVDNKGQICLVLDDSEEPGLLNMD
jgi:demethoxyubiquinone hydroxylase (CLK1/Coq7/Cat5 family)